MQYMTCTLSDGLGEWAAPSRFGCVAVKLDETFPDLSPLNISYFNLKESNAQSYFLMALAELWMN